MSKIIVLLLLIAFVNVINGHGRVLSPISRASRWRSDHFAPRNYDDDGMFCGGFWRQWGKNNGKCGLCGDDAAFKRPRKHELGGGPFGTGVITGTYQQGGVLPVKVEITTNHRGYFYFYLCNVDGMAESEDCFEKYPVKTVEGNDKFYLNSTANGFYNVNLQLPSDLNCRHCVLQWTYYTGNNWGFCPDGTGALGCGPQEHFRTCSDISILKY